MGRWYEMWAFKVWFYSLHYHSFQSYVLCIIAGGSVRAKSWKTALIFRSSTMASSTLWSSLRLLKKTLDATRALHLTCMAPTPRPLRSMWKVTFICLTQLQFNTVTDDKCVFLCAGASSSDSEGEHRFEHIAPWVFISIFILNDLTA